jgi:hypothetical protein
VAVCAKRKAAFVGVIHYNKKGDVGALQKILGASSVAGVARAAWGFSKNPDNQDEHFMSLVKSNLGKKRGGMKYQIVDAEVALPSGKATNAGKVEWLGETEEDADEVLAAERDRSGERRMNTKAEKAKAWLYERLKAGSVESKALWEEGEAFGFNVKMLYRAKEEAADIKCMKMRGGLWHWYIAKEDAQIPADIEAEDAAGAVKMDMVV